MINDCDYFTATKGPIMQHCQPFNPLSLSRFKTHNNQPKPSTPRRRLYVDWLKALFLMVSCLLASETAFANTNPTTIKTIPGNASYKVILTQPSSGAPATGSYLYINRNTTTGINATGCLLRPINGSPTSSFTGLTNGTAYTIQLQGCSGSTCASCTGSYTTAVNVTAGAPVGPTAISATPGNGQASISFTAGADNGSAITNYHYATNGTTTSGTFTAFSPAQTSNPLTITGLTNGTTYTIQLKGENANGVGNANINIPANTSPNTYTYVSVTPAAQVPSAPTALIGTPGNAQASISFTAGANNGSAITNYQYSTDGGTSFAAFSPAQTSSPVTITGLTNGTAYSIALKEVNAIGTSTASSTVSVTPASTPSAPSALIATPGAASAVLNYTAGATGGSAISNYQYSTDGGTSFTDFSPITTGNPLTITGLTNGTTYSLALKAVNAVGVGTASSTVSVTPNGACGVGVPITTGTAGSGALWQMLALPCVSANGSIAGVFGTDTLSNLTTANYASPAPPYIGWLIEKRTVGATPAYVPMLTSDLALEVGTGYWIKSFLAPTGGLLAMDGTTTPAAVTQLEGCYSANGCKAITVTTYRATYNRYNLVGNPFPYAIDWSKVRVRVDGSYTTYTPAQAAGVAEGGGNLLIPVISNTINIWNNTSYVAFTDVGPYPSTPNLQYFKSFWVNVLPGAFGHIVELLIPAEQSTQPIVLLNPVAPANLEQLASIEMPWYMGWLDWVIPSAAAATAPAVSQHVHPQRLANAKDWYIRLKVDNPVTGWQDHGALLGELTSSKAGFDSHDVYKMTPFAAPYLTLVFPHSTWGTNAGDYASDFHPVNSKAQSWKFEVQAKPVGSKVFLSWEGPAALLKRSRLIDAAGKVIKPTDKRWTQKGYPVTLKKAVQHFTWQVLAK